jgi:hypothetical protein
MGPIELDWRKPTARLNLPEGYNQGPPRFSELKNNSKTANSRYAFEEFLTQHAG